MKGSSNRMVGSGAVSRGRRARAVIAVAFALAVVVVVVVGGCARDRLGGSATPASDAIRARPTSFATASADASTNVVEVPSVVGLGFDEASLMLHSAGLVVSARASKGGTSERQVVSAQDPVAGTMAAGGGTVRLTFSASAGDGGVVPAMSGQKGTSTKRFVVCIDPGHQAHADTALEPVGPGSKEMRPRASGGATGGWTGIPEYEVALQLATNLADRLGARGVTVVMTRTTNDVDVTNSERAAIANRAHADLFVRIHADSSTDPTANGISTLFPAANHWTAPIVKESRRAGQLIQQATVRSTKAADLGASERSDLVGFNWAKVPSVLVEAGYLSNSVEDRLLASPRYQDELAQGIADGVMQYLQTKGR